MADRTVVLGHMQQQTQVWLNHARNVAQDILIGDEFDQSRSADWVSHFLTAGSMISNFMPGQSRPIAKAIILAVNQAVAADAESRRLEALSWYDATVRTLNRCATEFDSKVAEFVNNFWSGAGGFAGMSNESAVNQVMRQFWKSALLDRRGGLLFVDDSRAEEHARAVLQNYLRDWNSLFPAHNNTQRRVHDALRMFIRNQERLLGAPSQFVLVNLWGQVLRFPTWLHVIGYCRGGSRPEQLFRIACVRFSRGGTQNDAAGRSEVVSRGSTVLVWYRGSPDSGHQQFELIFYNNDPSIDLLINCIKGERREVLGAAIPGN